MPGPLPLSRPPPLPLLLPDVNTKFNVHHNAVICNQVFAYLVLFYCNICIRTYTGPKAQLIQNLLNAINQNQNLDKPAEPQRVNSVNPHIYNYGSHQ